MKLAFVVPRYGTEVVGGAEQGARMLAEHLVDQLGWQVEVFTTRAKDHMTWADEYPEGETLINGVRVVRITSKAGRDPGFNDFSAPMMHAPESVSLQDAADWIDRQGPVCPGVVDAADASDADLVAFYPYLYYPTVQGISRLGPRSIMHPAAHEEPPIRLPIFKDVFRATQGFAFHTRGERALVNKLFSVAEKPQVVSGLGIEVHEGSDLAATDAVGFEIGVGGRPYICCVGRVDAGKGSLVLAEMFAEHKRRHPSPLALVMVGPVADRPVEGPDVIVTGRVSEEAKWGIMAGSVALVSPSPHESFSLVAIEAWSAGVPVLVNGACDATREHCELSGGGWWYGGPPPTDQHVGKGTHSGSGRMSPTAGLHQLGIGGGDPMEDFDRAVVALVADGRLRSELVKAGQIYVDDNFRWETVVGRYSRFALRMAERAATG